MEPPSQGIFQYFPLKKAHFFTPPLPFPTSLRNSWALLAVHFQRGIRILLQMHHDLCTQRCTFLGRATWDRFLGYLPSFAPAFEVALDGGK
ncbi:MAG TPA: hypothetical protein VFV38_44535 [Ktedonobacteraceae bacterium]|nr:hypothetical protein [Ktedonobacteraceae bacterium]